LLLVLDNCEHLIAACAQLTERLLRTSPHLKVLATSRETLEVTGEFVYQLPALATPEPHNLPSTELLAEYASVRLFVERASLAMPDFRLTAENAPAIAQVCRQLDGIPLAIELAAARVKLLRMEEIAVRLGDRFRLLTAGSRTALPRQQTLLASIGWSWDLLPEQEQLLLRRLAVFAGGWTLAAAETVCGSPLQVLDLLTHLVNKSLVVLQRKPGVAARYRLLEIIRAFAWEKLEEAEETAIIRQRHFDFFYALAQQATLFGSEIGMWLNRLEAELDNLRVALTWQLAGEPIDDCPSLAVCAEKALQMLIPLLDFYWYRGYGMEAREWLNRLLAVEMPPSSIRAAGFQKAGWLARGSGNYELAATYLNQALAIAREIQDKDRIAWSLSDLGITLRDQGHLAQVIPALSEALILFQEGGNRRGIGSTLYILAETRMLAGETAAAKALWEQGLVLFRQEGDKGHISWGLEGLGGLAFLEKRFEEANTLHKESLKYKAEVMNKLGIAFSFDGLAQVAAAQGNSQRAAMLWGAAEQLRRLLGTPVDPSRQNVFTSLIPTARQALGLELFEQQWQKGRSLSLEQGVNYALGGK
jgi:non-specific serine/threonine protein kinase